MVKIITWNVNGLTHPLKRERIMQALVTYEVQVALLQETHLSGAEQNKVAKRGFNLAVGSVYEGARRRGVMIFLKKNTRAIMEATWEDEEGMLALWRGWINGQLYTLASVYLPPALGISKIREKIQQINAFTRGTLLAGGDWNLVTRP